MSDDAPDAIVDRGRVPSALWRKVTARVADALRAVDASQPEAAGNPGPDSPGCFADLRASLVRSKEILRAFEGVSSGVWEER